jgi:hypothetical protein
MNQYENTNSNQSGQPTVAQETPRSPGASPTPPIADTAINTGVSNRITMNGKPVFTVPAKTIINFKSGFVHKLLCDGLTFSAGTACCYECSFCYVPAAMRKRQPWMAEHGVTGKHEDIVIRRENAAEIVRRQLTDAKGKPRFNDPNDRRVIYASPLVDVAGNMELVRETVEICKVILNLTHWQIRLLSKSNLLPKIAQAIQEWNRHHCARLIFGVSTGTLDDGWPRSSSRARRWCRSGFRASTGSRKTASERLA